MPEKGVGHLLHARFNRITFNNVRAAFRGKLDGGVQQLRRDTLSPVRFLDEETGNGPDGSIIHWLQYSRAFKCNVLLTWSNCAPTDGFGIVISDNSRLCTSFDNRFERLLVRRALA